MTEEKRSLTYSDAGVNIDAANTALSTVKDLVRRTYTQHVLRDIGTFGAMFQLDLQNYREPVLVSSVDGVGTKLKLAFMTGKHDTVGVDLVSHCVNDILVQGAKPLFFLDYFAMGKLEPDVMVEVVRGLATGCRYSGCALIGGETAEMPDMYTVGEYDLAGTIVGIVDRSRIVDGSAIRAGDVIIGLPSSGLHTNGYSLARKICFEVAGLDVHDPMPGTGRTVAEALMEPHISYAKLMQVIMRTVDVRGMAHITGGGITDNLPRILPDGVAAEIRLDSWTVPPVFRFLKEAGNVDDKEMLRTFNMGQGFLFVVPEEHAARAKETIELAGQSCSFAGRIIEGDGKVHYSGNLNYANTSN
ncbi:MAG TPA: phosphoribosylformylglycinamidine cyclo-ligase [Candidatus Hydrogenedentes bacterium]|jgi:phosphoribosylformylglycinamidine cyclo-ligase|nr:MAG: Phosphoribosylformylglycinamidine cyclo-ligase [Candidatus Hydrogenedentes bacterium ADurb.Bin170]HNZ48050.1 phosphoribosylformylglycinamidine cyclo-ligase [Candidatus Hydrogenedentota bacterium]HOD94378.1 phosphoribosylformylglycinamidine cyclo-ligase [Candidatus Hydrogenedentota bacterium]HOH42671.1 phosphoribosylformylglycinamidine cyclo-ligase [Candidatus Hydrogenedentota bacterium]HOM49219.1 phosphoribosylformylglycinamidine cyclo-ligase [Candidatus Hydrogenedentota bacterium]